MSNPILDILQTLKFDVGLIPLSDFASSSNAILPNCWDKILLNLEVSMNVFLSYYVSRFFFLESGIVLTVPLWYLGDTNLDVALSDAIINATMSVNAIILAQNDLNVWAALLKLFHMIRVERPFRHYVRKGFFKLINHMIDNHVAHISCACGNFIITSSYEGVQIKMYNNATLLTFCAMLIRVPIDELTSVWAWQCIDYREGNLGTMTYLPGVDVTNLTVFIEYSKRHLLNPFCQLGAPPV